MKNKRLCELLGQLDPEAEVKVHAAAVIPDELLDVDLSAEEQMIDDGEILEIADSTTSILVYRANEVHIIADKVFED